MDLYFYMIPKATILNSISLKLCIKQCATKPQIMTSKLKTNQDILRSNLVAEVKRYLGYAEDVHFDYISVNEKTLDVDFRSRQDEQRKSDLQYYNVLDLMKREGTWFKPNTKAIEAIVQEHLPSPNVEAKFKEWCDSIKSFLLEEQPTDLNSCRFAIGTGTFGLSCFDEEKEPIEENDISLTFEEALECEGVDIIPMRKAVLKTSTGYTISGYKLTKLILDYIEPSLS